MQNYTDLRGASDELRFCERCCVFYSFFGSLGHRDCPYHPLAFNGAVEGEHHATGRWDCCGRGRAQRGCVPSDHRSALDADMEPLFMSLDTALKLKIPQEAIRQNGQTLPFTDGTHVGAVRVQRYDRDEHEHHSKHGLPKDGTYDPVTREHWKEELSSGGLVRVVSKQ